jgi:protein O-mannosyl-transferase
MDRSKAQTWGLAVTILVSTFLAYTPCLRGDFLWDDDAYISQNEELASLQGLHDIWFKPGSVQQYYPVTFTVFWMERHLWGLHSFGYHTVNIFLHSANAVLIGLILEGLGLSGAWIAAWLFALHPVQAESVAWMTELKNVLSTCFYLLTILFLLKSARTRRLWNSCYMIAITLFACALLSKSITVTLPVSFLLLSWWLSGTWDKRKAWQMAPFLILSLGAGLFTAYYEHHLDRAQGHLWDFTILERATIAGRAFWFYLTKLVDPAPLSFIYPRWTVHETTAFSFLYPASAIGFLGFLAYARRWWGKLPFACLLFFAISLSPALGFTSFYFMRYSFVADHFQYLASIGVFALAGWIIARSLEKLGIALPSPAGILVVTMLCANLALATARQTRKYTDSLSLWQDTLTINPDAAIAHHNMGIVLSNLGRWNEAIAHLRTAEALDPSFPQTHLALAYFAVHAKRWEDARHQYEEAFRLGIRDPDILKDYAALPRRSNGGGRPAKPPTRK